MSSKTSNKLFQLKNSTLKNDFDAAGSPTKETVLLLNESKETDSIYRELEIPSKETFIKSKLKEVEELKVYDALYDSNNVSFKGHHIKKMCADYHLLIRPLNKLYSYLPEEAVKAIKEFSEKHGKPILQSCFQILAPFEYFIETGEDKECKTYIILFIDKSDSRNREYNRVQEENVVTQIYSSGKDFSENRTWMNIISTFSNSNWHSNINYLITFIITYLVLLSLTYVFNVHFITSFILNFLLIRLIMILNKDNVSKKYWNSFNK